MHFEIYGCLAIDSLNGTKNEKKKKDSIATVHRCKYCRNPIHKIFSFGCINKQKNKNKNLVYRSDTLYAAVTASIRSRK